MAGFEASADSEKKWLSFFSSSEYDSGSSVVLRELTIGTRPCSSGAGGGGGLSGTVHAARVPRALPRAVRCRFESTRTACDAAAWNPAACFFVGRCWPSSSEERSSAIWYIHAQKRNFTWYSA